MFYRRKQKKGLWGQRIILSILAILIAALGFDYGKHWTLKRALEQEIARSEGVVTLQSVSVSPWPLLQNHLVLKDFRVNVSGTPLTVRQVHLRQGWRDWHLAHIRGKDIKMAESAQVQGAQGLLDTRDLAIQVKVSELLLTNVKIKLPLITVSGTQASFDFLYKMDTHHLSLKGDAPELSFTNGVIFGLNGEGSIQAKTPIQGDMKLKIKNIDKMMKGLVAAGIIEASQADLVTMGSNLLRGVGLQDISLPLKIQDGDVSLGPIVLFKIK